MHAAARGQQPQAVSGLPQRSPSVPKPTPHWRPSATATFARQRGYGGPGGVPVVPRARRRSADPTGGSADPSGGPRRRLRRSPRPLGAPLTPLAALGRLRRPPARLRRLPGRLRRHLGRHRLHLGRLCRRLVWPSLAKLWPNSRKLGSKVGRNRSMVASIGTSRSLVGDGLGSCRFPRNLRWCRPTSCWA